VLVWIQKHDYSYEESEILTSDEAIKIFEGYDWAQEIVQVEEIEGKDCPPGFGVVSEKGKILHIVPSESGECMIHFHYPEKKRFLILFSGTVQSTITLEQVSWKESVGYIELIFQGNLNQDEFGI
jgi:hypothetical protein